MATYTKETALYDTAAIAGDIQEAGTTASKYIAADSTGIMVYDGTSGAQTPSSVSTDTNNVFIDDDSVDVRTGSDVKASFGAITTIGPEDAAHAEIQEDSFAIYNGVPTECFKIESSSQTAQGVVAYTYDDDVGIVYSGTTSTGSKSKTYSDISTPYGVYVQAVHGTESSYAKAYAYGESSSSTFTTRTFEFRSGLKIQVKLNLVKSTSALTVKIESGYILAGTRTGSLTFKVVQYRKEQDVPAPTFLYGSLQYGASIGAYSSAMGWSLNSSGDYAFSEGYGVKATGDRSHAEGDRTTASAYAAHAEGMSTTANGQASHAEGSETSASDVEAHAEGKGSVASGYFSHAQNNYTVASRRAQTAIGEYNIAETGSSATRGSYSLIIGNGTSDTARSNALTVDWSGNVNIASGAKYKINGTALAASDVGAVPTTRTVNSKALSANISLTASDVGAVPTTRTVNGQALSADVADADYVTEQGTSSSWNYRKWNSGKIEAWRKYDFASASWTVWASPIRYMDKTISIPSGIFSAAPSIMATSASTQYWVVGCTASSATAGSLRLATVSSTAMATTVRLYAYTV